MPLPFRPNCLPAALGVLSHPTARAAWDACAQYLAEMLPVPLLVEDSEDPTMLAADGFAGLLVTPDRQRIDRAAVAQGLDELYLAYLRDQIGTRALDLHALDEWSQHEAQIERA